MNARGHGLQVISSDMELARFTNGFGADRRIIVPSIMFIALALGAVQWSQPGRDAAAPPSAEQEQRVGNAEEKSEYFPARYANHATEIETHLQPTPRLFLTLE